MEIQTRDVTPQYTFGTGNTVSGANNANQDMFYKLLAAQLQHQDPMESVDNSQLILQMAQFAQIESSKQLTEQFGVFLELNSMAIGADMVGKEVMVSVQQEDGKTGTKTGIVERVGYTSQGPVLQIDGEYHEMWSVITVSRPGASSTPTTDSTGNSNESIESSETPTEDN